MINRVILVGRITKDPEVKTTQSNIPVVSFTIAVNRQFTDESGNRQADFIQCVMWRKPAENMGKYVRKGNLLGIDGRIQARQYESDNGMRYVTEVICDSVQFLEAKGEQQSEEYNEEQAEQVKRTYDEVGVKSKKKEDDEDLPF